MKSRLLLLPFGCLCLFNPCSADTFVMKDGTRLDATILKEDAESYFLEVQVTKSIKDERKVAKAEVKEIEKDKPDEKAFEKLKGLLPTPDLLPSDEYDKRILPITAFLKAYPDSPRAAEAKSMLATLKAEGLAVLGGGFKVGGKVISKEEYEANAYEIDARVLESRIRAAAANEDLLGALRGLRRIDEEYIPTASRKALVPLKQQVLQAYKAQITEQLATLPDRTAARTTELARMSQADKVKTEQALAEEMEQVDKRFKMEDGGEVFWVATHPFHQKSLEHAAEQIRNVMDGGDFAEAKGDGGKVYREVLELIKTSDNKDAIRQAIYAATEIEISEKYLAKLRAAAGAKGVTF